jgi:hypothetical protein
VLGYSTKRFGIHCIRSLVVQSYVIVRVILFQNWDVILMIQNLPMIFIRRFRHCQALPQAANPLSTLTPTSMGAGMLQLGCNGSSVFRCGSEKLKQREPSVTLVSLPTVTSNIGVRYSKPLGYSSPHNPRPIYAHTGHRCLGHTHTLVPKSCMPTQATGSYTPPHIPRLYTPTGAQAIHAYTSLGHTRNPGQARTHPPRSHV